MSAVYEIPGLSNWEMKIEKTEDKVTILSAATGDKKATLPDEIEGITVTAIKDRALAPGAACQQGESLLVTYGSHREEADNRKIESLTLPKELKTLGSYALMNCRSLKTLCFYDKIEYIGVSPFMNCHEMKELHFIRSDGGSCEALYFILSSMPKEFDLTVEEPDGSLARFVIPEYYELLEENEPTHFFNMTIEGGGYPYHAVFGRNGFSIHEYDELFPAFIKGYYEKATAMRMAYNRVRFPTGLSEAAEARYKEFLRSTAAEALRFAVENRDINGLQMLLTTGMKENELKDALQLARENEFTEAVAVLLEATHSSAPRTGRRRYEL